jgi:UDP-N-acetylmuramoyl-L-alanyl-D-glutamate--2,6-diaminopimelate ligase
MTPRARTLGELASLVGGEVRGETATSVLDVTHDSRKVRPGWLYVAMRGSRVDGHDFVPEAVTAGAAAVCLEEESEAGVPQLLVADTRAALGPLSAAAHDFPSRAVDVVGVTGTNGKTTVTHHVESIAGASGLKTGLIGTIHSRVGYETLPPGLTTPEASDFQRLLAMMRDEGVAVAAVEVSSHALQLERVRGTHFAVAAFTNISQDHLDFHGDMTSYRAAKERLFTDYEVGTAVINIDDPVGADIASAFRGRSLTVGRDGDVSYDAVERSPGGQTSFHLTTPWGSADVTAPVVGEFNVANLALAAACSVAVGLDFEAVANALPSVAGVPGRFEVVSGDDPITVIVDFAHTPEAVARAVETGRALTNGRVIALLGAGGDRDRRKRPAMGAAVSSADLCLITSDNPRTEDPADIVSEVSSGLVPGSPHLVEVDRGTAIRMAIDAADDGDVVLILGRGHETHQQVGKEKVEFDDRVVAAGALNRRRESADPARVRGRMSQ